LIFSKQSNLPKGVDKLQIKDLAFNKSPMFVPNVYKLSDNIINQLQIDMPKCLKNLDFIKSNQTEISQAIEDIYKNNNERPKSSDVDQSLYDGFIDNSDRKICNQIQELSVDKLKDFYPQFKDTKLSKLFLHFKARNYPQLLSEEERDDWFEVVQGRVQEGNNGYMSSTSFYNRLNTLRNNNPENKFLWQQLESYAESFL